MTAVIDRDGLMMSARFALTDIKRLRERLENDLGMECSRTVCLEPEVHELAALALTLLSVRDAALALADIKLAGESEPFWEAFLALREALGLESDAAS